MEKMLLKRNEGIINYILNIIDVYVCKYGGVQNRHRNSWSLNKKHKAMKTSFFSHKSSVA